MRRHLLASFVFLLACLAMAQTWGTPWVWPLLAGCLLLTLAISRDPRDLAFFALGIGLGGFIDVLQTGAGVTVYATPGPILRFPGYVLAYWGMAGVALRHLYALFPSARSHPADAALFVGAILLSLLGNVAPVGVALLMAAGLVAHGWVLRRRGDLLAALLVLVVGPLTESMLIRTGLYHFPSAGNQLIALWLYPLYAAIGAALRGILPRLERLVGFLGIMPSVDADRP